MIIAKTEQIAIIEFLELLTILTVNINYITDSDNLKNKLSCKFLHTWFREVLHYSRFQLFLVKVEDAELK